MLVIIDYGMGNLKSLSNTLDRLDYKYKISSDINEIRNATSLILPGVGAFKDAMRNLEELGLVDVIKESVRNKTPILGICLGMQLLFDESEEFGLTKGLGLLRGVVKYLDVEQKVPHMGWNKLYFRNENRITRRINEGEYVYFVHSYYATGCEDIIAYCDYGTEIPAIVGKDNILGMQFHPEKSSEVGMNLLKEFKEMIS